MMQLVIIGGKSASTLKGYIKEKFDSVDVTTFGSIHEFYNIINIRSMQVDRLFIMQDAITEDIQDDTLMVLNHYLGNYYPVLRLLVIMNNEETIERFSRIFISAHTVHILLDTFKPKMLLDFVEAQPAILRKKYGYTPKTPDTDIVIGGVVDTLPEEDESNLPLGENVNPNQLQPQGKQKRGLFNLFGGKSKGKKKNKPSKQSKIPERTYNPVLIDRPEIDPSTVNKPIGEVDSEQEDLDNLDNSIDDVNDDTDSGNIDFHMFDEESDIGVGVSVPRNLPEITQPQENEKEEDSDEYLVIPEVVKPSLDNIDFSAFEEIKEEEINADKTDDKLEDIAFHNNESEYETEFYKPELVIEEEEEDSEESQVGESSDNEAFTKERLNRIQELKESVFSKDIILDVDTDVEPIKPKVDIVLEEVEESLPLFTDIDAIEKAYDSNNVQVVEKVVETVVEKVVTLEGKKKAYKNGVRTIVVTGDRKTGITRTAMNLAAFYGKTSKTLYVDFDIERKGSLLYIGLETIAQEEDYVQSSLVHLKSVNALSNITYSFLSGGFDWLGSIHGVDLEEGQLRNVQRILSMQKDYKTIVIDCPLDKLSYLEDIILYSEVLVCVESNLQNVLNTILGLSSAFKDEKFLPFLYNNSHYFLSKNNKKSEFKSNLDYLTEMFSLDEDTLNWGQTALIGSIGEFQDVVNKL